MKRLLGPGVVLAAALPAVAQQAAPDMPGHCQRRPRRPLRPALKPAYGDEPGGAIGFVRLRLR